MLQRLHSRYFTNFASNKLSRFVLRTSRVDTMSTPISFGGRVVIITGAGGGLGRCYALEFARRGAQVVVNDLGGSATGDGTNSRAADLVVDEIKRAGGKAVANYNSVEDGAAIVDTAMSSFGRVDVVINNAGILRDQSFVKMTAENWQRILDIHLTGTYAVTRAAFPHMRKQQFGRIVMTSSIAGLYGNFGQANYSAAKCAFVGFSATLAKEGEKHNVKCNVIAPNAGTRLTQTVMPEDVVEAMKPEYCVPLTVYLASEQCEESGSVYETGGGWVSQVRWQRSAGITLSDKTNPDELAERWNDVGDFSLGTDYPTGPMETINKIMECVGSTAVHKPTTWQEAVGSSLPDLHFAMTPEKAILYALSVGVSLKQQNSLQYLYENHPIFTVLPSFCVIPPFEALFQLDVPGIPIDLTQLLHGEQYIELFRPIPSTGKFTTKTTISDIVDKGSGAVIVCEQETFDDAGEKLFHNQFVIFLMGAGGFGGPRKSTTAVALQSVPSRKPDAVVRDTTTIDQAAMYRLNGDNNPLHMDPSFAAMGGHERPILHGLCSFGIAVRQILETYAAHDYKLMKSCKVRFSKPVLPGQTVETRMWQENQRIHFEVAVQETGDICISQGWLDLHKATHFSAVKLPPTPQPPFVTDPYFMEMSRNVSAQKDLFSSLNEVFVWKIIHGRDTLRQYVFDCRPSKCRVYEGEPEVAPKAVLQAEEEAVLHMFRNGFPPELRGGVTIGVLRVEGKLPDVADFLRALEGSYKSKI